MWLPTPIYESTPHLWLLMAILFVVLGVYIGFAYSLTYFYVLLGVICGVRGLQVRQMRRKFRSATTAETEPHGDSIVEPAGN
jgi:hypothetical protein